MQPHSKVRATPCMGPRSDIGAPAPASLFIRGRFHVQLPMTQCIVEIALSKQRSASLFGQGWKDNRR